MGFLSWMFEQREQRVNCYENTVIRDAFADPEWDGHLSTLKKRITEIGDDYHLEAFKRLVSSYRGYVKLERLDPKSKF